MSERADPWDEMRHHARLILADFAGNVALRVDDLEPHGTGSSWFLEDQAKRVADGRAPWPEAVREAWAINLPMFLEEMYLGPKWGDPGFEEQLCASIAIAPLLPWGDSTANLAGTVDRASEVFGCLIQFPWSSEVIAMENQPLMEDRGSLAYFDELNSCLQSAEEFFNGNVDVVVSGLLEHSRGHLG